MNRIGRVILALGLVVALGGCGAQPGQTATNPGNQQPQTKRFEKVRGPVVAGAVKPEDGSEPIDPALWYPRHAETLAKMVDGFLAEATPEPVENLRGLVCPHAGYEFSGKIAGSGYKLLAGRDVRTVIVLGPTHTAAFKGASIPDADAYETPLGLIPVSPKAAELARVKPFVLNPPCEVQRPMFWRQSLGGAPRPGNQPPERPPFGEDTPHTWEYSVEVQLPFLQRTLKQFDIVPAVFGQVDPEAVARVLLKHLDDQTLVVASSDLSHHLPYELARGMDTTCCQAVCSLKTEWMEQQQACGRGPILTLMHIARLKGWKAKLLDYRNSGDTSGDKSDGVVGYAAIAFYQPKGAAATEGPPAPPEPGKLTPAQEKFLLALARKTLTDVVQRRRMAARLPWGTDGVPKELIPPRGCFVTLNKDGRLRGCIGSIFPQMRLHQAVMHAAISAALADRRFDPVQPSELDQIEIEISLLTFPTRLEFKSPEELLEKLRPRVDGVVLRVGQKQAVYLPQVWEQIPDKEDFLSRLAEKAGLGPSDWKSPEARVRIFQAEAFHESEK